LPLVADAFALYVKTKNFHWHLSGARFRDIHLLLDEQAEAIFATIDPWPSGSGASVGRRSAASRT
jgi:starvation-inducible DNA-binding protein